MQSVHALFGYFLRDRTSPTPFPGRDELAHASTFEWGIGPPLEQVVTSKLELDSLLGLPELFRQSISIVEPWPDVGVNVHRENVRASKNVAYLLQQIADANTILYPVWQSGIANPERLANVMSAGMATIIEGGSPSAYQPASFDGTKANLEDILLLTDQLLLRRSARDATQIYICLGHQLAATSHIRLIRRAVREVMSQSDLPHDPEKHALKSLRRVCRRIAAIGEELVIRKAGQTLARGWNDTRFATAANEALEVGSRRLVPYRRRETASHVPGELHDMHSLVADELEGVIDTMIAIERELIIEMFHADEVNEEAVLFANWAYKSLHDVIAPMRHEVAISPLAWLLCLPYAVEILSQTHVDDFVMTEVGTSCVYYKDWETHNIRRSFTCQFHPELMADIRDIGRRHGPRYQELKDNDGVRLLIRLLYYGMQE